MASFVQANFTRMPAGVSGQISFLVDVTAGTMLVLQLMPSGAVISGVTDTLGNVWQLVEASFVEVWWVDVGAVSGPNTVTVTFAAPTFGESPAWVYEFAGMGTAPTVENTASLDVFSENSPATFAPLTTLQEGVVLTVGLSNTGEGQILFTSWNDSFLDGSGDANSGDAPGMGRSAYRLAAAGGIAAAPTMEFTPTNFFADTFSLTVGFAVGGGSEGCSDDWGTERADGLPYVPLMPEP